MNANVLIFRLLAWFALGQLLVWWLCPQAFMVEGLEDPRVLLFVTLFTNTWFLLLWALHRAFRSN